MVIVCDHAQSAKGLITPLIARATWPWSPQQHSAYHCVQTRHGKKGKVGSSHLQQQPNLGLHSVGALGDSLLAYTAGQITLYSHAYF